MSNAPYRTVAVASTFSPRFIKVLAEANRLRQRFGADLRLIYVGERDEATLRRFSSAFAELQLPADLPVHFETGDPARAILKVCDEEAVDIVIAGALEREVILRPLLGDVARTLVREARCSVVLFTKPEAPPLPFRRIVFLADYSEHGLRALQTTISLAAAEQSERLYVVRVYTSFDEARAAAQTPNARTIEEEERALEEFIDRAGSTEVPIEAHCLRGTSGFAALDFIQSVAANLLAVPVDPSEGGALPNNVAWVTETIPCNLWVIR